MDIQEYIKSGNIEQYKFKKVILDRLNHLKSDLAGEENPKMDKILNKEKINSLKIRIRELEYLIFKNEK